MQLVVNRGKAKGKAIPVHGPRFLIGRGPECQLRPLSDEVGVRHAELKIRNGLVVLIDLGSASGTRVNGQTLTGPVSVRNGDCIEIGPLSFTALVEKKARPKRPKRLTEDQVASWLVDETNDEEGETTPVRKTAQETSRASSQASNRRATEAADQDAFDLLRSMTAHPQ